MAQIFQNCPLSTANKGKIHESFSTNNNWSYDWRQYIAMDNSNFQTAVNLWFSDEANATATYGHIRDWNVSQVTNMHATFRHRNTFDENITGWDVSNVTTMNQMFDGANTFNQPIGDWNVSSVTNMQDMFRSATDFNQSIGNWNTSSVTTMETMFNLSLIHI